MTGPADRDGASVRRMQAAVAGARPRGRWRWVFAAVWLVYLGEPLSALLERAPGWPRDLGLAALAAFVAGYLVAVARTRWRPSPAGPPTGALTTWLWLAVLLALAGLVLPGAGVHALATLPYAAALAVMNLPTRQAAAVVGTLFVGSELLLHTVPGWDDTGYGLGVVLAAVAVYGVRLAFERNEHLARTQDELARLAVASERSRIAGDLHDILGHSLTVIAVKAELAQRLLDVDRERARAELADLEKLSRDALADVRATALGVRGVSLPGEIAAARAALGAAGIEAELPTAADEVPSRLRELYAWTIRETVTNAVRHSSASHLAIRMSADCLEVLDDGVGVRPGEGGQGLAGLRRRAEALGARLQVGNRTDAPGFAVRLETGR